MCYFRIFTLTLPRVAVLSFILLLTTLSLADVPGLNFNLHPESQIKLPGEEVLFECALNVSSDRVEWKHRGQLIPKVSSRGVGRLRIQISKDPAKYTQQTGFYQCIAWFGASAMASKPAELQVAHLDQQINNLETINKQYVLAPGNVFQLNCPPPESTPPAIINYYKNESYIHLENTGSHLLTNLSSKDNGVYTCVAVNSFTNERVKLPYKYELKVEYPSASLPTNVISPHKTNYTVLAGNDIRLECPSVGWPVPYNSWTKYGGLLSKNHSITTYGALRLNSVSVSDEGTYVCDSSNGYGESTRTVISLNVNDYPQMVKEPVSSKVEEGGDVSFECSAKGNPTPVITWLQNGGPVDTDSHIITSGSRLHIKLVEKRHAGLFQCFAINSVGSAFGLAMLQVQPKPITSRSDDMIETPNGNGKQSHRKHNGNRKHGNKNQRPIMIPPSKPNITRLSDESVMVRWSVPSDEGLPIQFFKVQYKDLGMGSAWHTVDDDIPPHIRSYEVDTLTTDHFYRFRIAAVYTNNDNKLGLHSVKFHLQKEPATKRPLYPPTLTNARALSPSAIEIEWEYLNQPSIPIEGFFIYYRSTTMAGDYTKATTLGENTRSFLITHLLPDNSYDIKMQSFNNAGTSDFSAIRSYRTQYVPTTPEPGSDSPSKSGNGDNLFNTVANEGSSNQLGMVIGIVLGGLFLLLLLLSVGVYICRQTGARTASSDHDQAKEVQAYGLAAVGKPLTNGNNHHLHIHHRHHPRVHITANPLAAATDHYKSDGELDVSGQNNNCSALLERRIEDEITDDVDDDEEGETSSSSENRSCENYV